MDKREEYAIGIRTDANDKIAMGHLVRCMSIAKQLRNIGQNILFIISEQYAKDYITENGFECICLDNRYNEKESEVESLIRILEGYNIKKLLLDSYEITYSYMEKLKQQTKLIYLDDINRFRYPADIIINYADSANILQYEGKGYEEEIFLLGSQFVPLRPEFQEAAIRVNEKVERIFLTTGGTDSFHMILSILNEMKKNGLKTIEKHVVTGKFYGDLTELKEMAAKDESIKVYHDISDVCTVMKMCDMAISAGGTTMIELCACGIPTICFTMAENQIPATKAFEKKGIIQYAGDIGNGNQKVADNIIKNILLLMKDYECRKDLAHRARATVDGRGANRIAERIVEL